MVRKLLLGGVAALSLGFSAQGAHAATISFTYDPHGNLPGYTTAQVIQNFDSLVEGLLPSSANSVGSNSVLSSSHGWTSGAVAAGIRPGEVGGTMIAGFKPTSGNFLAIGSISNNVSGGTPNSFAIDFAKPGMQFFSFIYGSLDTEDTLSLYNGSTLLAELTGAQIAFGDSSISPYVPSSFARRDGRASFDFNGGLGLTRAVFSTTYTAFEIDEIAAAAPEPATWAMMLAGFGLVGWRLRRRRGKPVTGQLSGALPG